MSELLLLEVYSILFNNTYTTSNFTTFYLIRRFTSFEEDTRAY